MSNISGPDSRCLRMEIKRKLYCLLAFVSFGIAVVAVVVPGLPSTEFVLLAAWAAAKGSPRFHQWIINHPWFGSVIKRWQDERTVSRATQIRSSISMGACLVILWFWVPHIWVSLFATVGIAIGMIYLWRIPNERKPVNES